MEVWFIINVGPKYVFCAAGASPLSRTGKKVLGDFMNIKGGLQFKRGVFYTVCPMYSPGGGPFLSYRLLIRPKSGEG